MKYRKIKFGDACELVRGISYKSSDYSVAEDPDAEVFINLKCVTKDGFRNDGIKYYKGDHKNTQSLTTGDLLIANTDLTRNRAVIGNSILVPALDRSRACFSMDLCKINITDSSKLDKFYLYYYLKSPKARWYMINHSDGSTVVHLSTSSVSEMEMEVPSIEEQKKIVSILSSIDRKIACNNRTNDNLYSIGETLFKEKIDSNSYAEKRKLRSFFPVVTGKKDANAATEDGKYPFFTCSRQISRINDYTFDSSAILLAGNGDFNVKFYRGKFDAYQRTYVLIPEDKLLLGYLYWAISIKLSDITSNFRGSVIRFITKGNIEDYEVAYLPDPRILNQFQSYLEMIEANNLENERLTKLRDTLLPELLNGKIDISNIDI
jgi:type-1 restriction enzyme ecoDI specificity protein